jgi:nucleoside-diphosphate-sugar epimerase
MLVERGDKVAVIDVVPGSRFLEDIKDKINSRVGDMANWVHVAETVQQNKVDIIYHVGAVVPPLSEANPATAFSGNVVGMFNILEAARLFDVKKVIFTSTQSTYSDGDMLIPDDFTQRPNTFYGITKVCGERLGEGYWMKHGVDFRGVRYPIVNGPGRILEVPGQYVVWAQQMPALGRPFKVFVEPETEVPTLYVKDAARALIDLAEADGSKLTQRIYSLLGYSITARGLVELVKKHIPGADLSFRVNESIMEQLRKLSIGRCMDSSAAQRDWGFKPAFGPEEALKDYIKQCTEHRQLLDYPIPDW